MMKAENPLPIEHLVMWKDSFGEDEYYEDGRADREKAMEMAASAPKMSGPFRFFDLPFDVRTIIYQYLLTSSYGVHVNPNFKDWAATIDEKVILEGDYATALLYTCKEAYDEGKKVALSRNTIKFWDARIAMNMMRHLKMDKEKYPYRIVIDQLLHWRYHDGPIPGSGSQPEVYESVKPYLVEMIGFCKENPHIQVQLNVTDIRPEDFNESEPERVAWYDHLLACRSNFPTSMTIGFELDPYEHRKYYDPEKWYDILEPRLRCWAPGGLKRLDPIPCCDDSNCYCDSDYGD